MEVKIKKDTVLAIAGGLFTIGSAVVGFMSKKDEKNEVAEKAAKIVMDQMSKKED